MGARLAIVIVALVTSIVVLETLAFAQTPGGAFDRLAPGEQKIARSLYAAQRRDLPSGRRLSLDQIAAAKGTEGWGNVFKDMKSQGLVTQKNLGQVISRGEGRPATAASGIVSGANHAHEQAVGNSPAGIRPRSDDAPHGGAMSSANVGGGHGRGK
ncbi:MAG: hypothetical protein HY216_06705 [Candidatus Rokubacteria bacterium]|nr:hypothetical protein [Candidatus Rokubacteria bacterium]